MNERTQEGARGVIVMPSGSARGGAEEALLQLIRNWDRTGLGAVRIVCLESGDLPAALAMSGASVQVIEAGRLRELGKVGGTVSRIAAILREHRAAVVLNWMTKAHVYGGLAGILTGVPALYFQMGLPDDGTVDRLSRLVPARGALACSEFAARAQAARTSVPVIGVPLAADLERFDPGKLPSMTEARERLGLPTDRPVVGIVGRLQRWKGMHVFAEAIARVRAARPEVLGVIVGGVHDLEADYEPELRRIIAGLGQAEGDGIRMVGKQSNVPEWMMAMDVVVHASDREPFGIVVVEAMALGKPVIAAKPGGPEEIIDDGVDGLLTSYGDVEALAAAMNLYLDDVEFAAARGRAARETALRFSPERFAERVGLAVRKLIG